MYAVSSRYTRTYTTCLDTYNMIMIYDSLWCRAWCEILFSYSFDFNLSSYTFLLIYFFNCIPGQSDGDGQKR